jgi:hypothetical protein
MSIQRVSSPAGATDNQSSAFGQTVVMPESMPMTVAMPMGGGSSSELQSTVVASSSGSPGGAVQPAEGSPAAAASRYESVRQIGEGGMGEVLLSRDPTIGRQVAIKRMKPDQSADAASRFMAEVKTTGQLEHPGIVPIYDAGRDAQGTPYFVMKYVKTQKNAAISRSFAGDYMPPRGDLNHARRAPTSSPGITLGSARSPGGPRWET